MNDKKIIVALDSNNLYDLKYLVDEIKNLINVKIWVNTQNTE